MIECHYCPIDENNLDYFVTTDNIPHHLNNCTIIKMGDVCYIDLIWNRTPVKTQIGLSGKGDEKSIDAEHTLVTNVNVENKNLSIIWTRTISYICSTDKCNSLSALKGVLDSLTLNDTLHELVDLLQRKEPFEGNWCKFSTNGTLFECATEISPASCKQCSFQGISNHGVVELCANCLEDDIGETFLSHEVNFNMTDRTRDDHWILECGFENCNTYDNGNLVRQKSTSDFDFEKFLDGNNKSISLSSISKTVLLFVVFCIKFLN